MENYIGMMGGSGLYWMIFIGTAVLSWLVSSSLNKAFKNYSKIPTTGNLTGKEVAEKMLRDNDIYDVQVTCIQGHLTDNYNPANKTLNLSPDVYNSNSVAAAAVAAHECGHAVQHATMYSWLQMRSNLVPVVSFASKWVTWLLLGGMLLLRTFPQLLLAGIVLFALTTLFSLCGIGHAEASVWNDSNDEKRQTELFISQQNKQQAIASDSSDVYQICSSRSGRVNPAKPSEHFRLDVRNHPLLFNPQIVSCGEYCGRKTPSTIPLLSMSVADRYVYWLRRLIC